MYDETQEEKKKLIIFQKQKMRTGLKTQNGRETFPVRVSVRFFPF